MISFCDDESKVASFMWYHNGKHVSEAKAVAINDAFDSLAYAASHELEKTGPPKARKRSFDPAPAGPSTPQRDLNRLLSTKARRRPPIRPLLSSARSRTSAQSLE